MKRVLVSDNLGEAGIKMFDAEADIEVDVNTGLEPQELKSIIGDYDALVIRSATKVTEDLIPGWSRRNLNPLLGIMMHW
jgi:D-3-phosphoglycerate dehydrogenase